MWTNLYWVDGPWAGKLALAARPRGGDWLEDEMSGWRGAGVDTVLSLLTPDEEQDLDLAHEAREVVAHGMAFESFPIPDLQVPTSEEDLAKALDMLDADLAAGRNVVVHCRQGIGRTGLVASCLFLMKGLDPETVIRRLNEARGIPVPETHEQRRWIDRYAARFASLR